MMKIMDCPESSSSNLAARLPLIPQGERSGRLQPRAAAPLTTAPERGELTGAQQALASAMADANSSAEEQPPPELARQEKKKRDTDQREKRDQKRNWLMTDPQRWIGRRVRSRRKNTVYTVSEVFNTGRVKLERNWMTYLTDVQTVRVEYETYC
jgi:hypothetical protein